MTIHQIGGPDPVSAPSTGRLNVNAFLHQRIESLETERDSLQATMQRQGEQLRQLRDATEKLGDNLREVLDRVSEALCDNEPLYAAGYVDGSTGGLLFSLTQLEEILGIDRVAGNG